jgi:hypothetical protein
MGLYKYRHADCWEGFIKYPFEMGSGSIIYIPRFIMNGSGIQKLTRGIHRQRSDLISPLLFLSKWESRLKILGKW